MRAVEATMEASPDNPRSIDAAAAVHEKIGEKIDAFRHNGEEQPWARAVVHRLTHETPSDDMASFLAFSIQRQVQRQLANDDLRQLYDAYASHGYADIASALARKAHDDAIAAARFISAPAAVAVSLSPNTSDQRQHLQKAGEKRSLSPSSPTALDPPSPSPIRVDKSRRLKEARRTRRNKPTNGTTSKSLAERDKMKAIEAQIRASQLARFAMRSGTRKSLR